MKSYKQFMLHLLEEVDSTNSYAFSLAKNNNAFDREVVIANRQYLGRGRINRKWESMDGNLFCSIIIKPNIIKIPSSQAHRLSFFAILALKNAILALNDDDNNQIQLKWPNDLLINGKKVAGILLESSLSNDHIDFAIIGVGVNIIKYPNNMLFEATSLLDEKIMIDRDGVLEKFLDEFEQLYVLIEQFGLDKAFANIKRALVKNAYKLGEKIEVNLGTKKISGIFEDIDKNGSMILLQGSNKLVIHFGDVC
ncbi:MAG: biotin--[acetyl-CoA-carboxylase] ligase [Rickettsiales bacterium]|nr:biotin--[acetyl-CoA-carboxylase] ligase [Rickettsiales bacterium]